MTRTALIGDSHVGGLKKYITADVVETRVGWSSVQYADDWPNVTADRFIIVLGTNDFYLSSSPSKLRNAFTKIISQIRFTNNSPQIYWAGPPACKRVDLPASLDKVAAIQQEAARENGVTWIDSRRWSGSGHASDGVHYTATGYQLWATGLAGSIDTSPANTIRKALNADPAATAIIIGVGAVLVLSALRRM